MSFYIRIFLILSFWATPLYALQERHLIVVRHGESEAESNHLYNSTPSHPNYRVLHLTHKGLGQIKEVAEILLTYGFDNRNIAAVYVSPLPRAQESAHIIARFGVFDASKIKVEPRLIEMKAGELEGTLVKSTKDDILWVGNQEALGYQGEGSEEVATRLVSLYDELEKRHTQGHVIVITHLVPAYELIQSLTKNKVKLNLAQAYLIPLRERKIT